MGARLVLILGGTAEAAGLARTLAGREDWRPLTSLAGRTSRPGQIAGEVRTGGFGGIEGLVDWLVRHRPAALVDATHPFARQMPHHARAACALAAVPRLRLLRPAWPRTAGDRWIEVESVDEAVRVLPRLGRTAFLSTGHEGLAAFAGLMPAMRLVVRTIEPLMDVPDSVVAIRGRPPFTPDGETELLRRHGIDVLVSKMAGGDATVAKIEAARALALPVVMLARPALPDGPLVHDVEDVVRWLAGLGA